ncbi:MAG TPA: hypothetical protein VM328_12960 [Fimbriimonadaceae bacterium]|nr:hypothetical protein [Fimbriimonadaceae bacterium]
MSGELFRDLPAGRWLEEVTQRGARAVEKRLGVLLSLPRRRPNVEILDRPKGFGE